MCNLAGVQEVADVCVLPQCFKSEVSPVCCLENQIIYGREEELGVGRGGDKEVHGVWGDNKER